MLSTYFKIAWRNIMRHKMYSLLNVLGLALGICACLSLYLIVQYEFSFDRFLPDVNRIYRVVGEATNDKGEKNFLNSPFNDVAPFETQIPGFEKKTAFFDCGWSIQVPNGSKPPKQFDNSIPGTYSATAILTKPSYFDIFHRDWLAGNPNVLDKPFEVVLTEGRARMYFGNIPLPDMIGKTVIYDDSVKTSVAGIVKDWTHHSDFNYTDFISLSTATHTYTPWHVATEDWTSLNPHRSMAFVKLDRGVTAAQVDDRFAAWMHDHIHDTHQKVRMYLQPLTGIHFTPNFHLTDDGDDLRKAYMPTLYALMGVAAFILLLAVVNFINLSTAQSMQRGREIGVRKVMGGRRSSIMSQFFAETLVLTLLAAALSILLTRPVLYLFRDYIPDGVSFDPWDPKTLLFIGIVVAVTTLLAGFYPARVLASYMPALTLKGNVLQRGETRSTLRKSLIVFQFVISLVFIIGSLVIAKQIHFMRSADKGFSADAVITIGGWSWHSDPSKVKVLASKIEELPGVSKVLREGHDPMGYAQSMSTFSYHGGKDSVQLTAYTQTADDGFIPFYQLKLLAGRNMMHSDSLNEFVINETMAKAIGFADPGDAVGKFLQMGNGGGKNKGYPIVGVVADFHMETFHDAIKPSVIGNWTDQEKNIAVKLSPAVAETKDLKRVLAAMQAETKKIFPEADFEYKFMNESIARLYEQEENTAWLANASMLITIFISCMGLFGLAMYSAQRRVKEIGIRKVLGASVSQIVLLLNREFVILVTLALVVAAPIAYYISNAWLQDFVYRTDITWWIFAAAGMAALCIALLTVSYQAIRAATANPVNSLRAE